MDFLILSLPRSGTAWLANFLTYDDCFCYHEPLADAHLRHERVRPITGAIDTTVYMTNHSAPREYALVRNYDDITKSLKALSPIFVEDDLARFRDRTKHLSTFFYDKLFDVDYLEMVWTTITKRPFNRPRAELLIEMNVQRDFRKLIARVGRSHFVS